MAAPMAAELRLRPVPVVGADARLTDEGSVVSVSQGHVSVAYLETAESKARSSAAQQHVALAMDHTPECEAASQGLAQAEPDVSKGATPTDRARSGVHVAAVRSGDLI